MFDNIIAEFNDPFAAIPLDVALLRLLAAMLLSGIIGWEREVIEKPAGLRTHMLVALAACLFTLLTFELMEVDLRDDDRVRTDPIRLIEAITSGVAFLAAGMIFTHQDKVRGLTTGAGLWLAGAIGVSCGLGRLSLAIMATAIAVTVLWLARRFLAVYGPKKAPRG